MCQECQSKIYFQHYCLVWSDRLQWLRLDRKVVLVPTSSSVVTKCLDHDQISEELDRNIKVFVRHGRHLHCHLRVYIWIMQCCNVSTQHNQQTCYDLNSLWPSGTYSRQAAGMQLLIPLYLQLSHVSLHRDSTSENVQLFHSCRKLRMHVRRRNIVFSQVQA